MVKNYTSILLVVFVILVILIILIIVQNKKEKDITIQGNGNLIIEYTNEPQSIMNSKRIIRIYDNKGVEFALENSDVVRTKFISDEEYQNIINLAFSKKILSLEGKDISNSNVLDGYWTYITIYTENSKGIRIGGSNPSNKEFNKLVRLIRDLEKNE